MLMPPFGLGAPWHSKQYFLKVWGGLEGLAAREATGRAGATAVWADIIDAPASTSAPHNPTRV